MKQRSKVGDLIPADVLQGDVLVMKKSSEAASAFKPAIKLQRPKVPKEWLARSGRQLDLNDGRNPKLTLLCV